MYLIFFVGEDAGVDLVVVFLLELHHAQLLVDLRVLPLLAHQLLLVLAQRLEVLPLRLATLEPRLEGPQQAVVVVLHLLFGLVEPCVGRGVLISLSYICSVRAYSYRRNWAFSWLSRFLAFYIALFLSSSAFCNCSACSCLKASISLVRSSSFFVRVLHFISVSSSFSSSFLFWR